MTGEMHSSEVTPDNYPDLFELKENLESMGAKVEARPFDKYQGPYLEVEYSGIHFRVWYHSEWHDVFAMEYHLKGKDYFFEFHKFDWESPIQHLQEMFGGELGTKINSLDEVHRKILEDNFNNDVGKFSTWLEMGEPRDFERKPTIKDEVKLFSVNIDSTQTVLTPEAWEKIEDKVAALLEQEGISGHVESSATGNSTSF